MNWKTCTESGCKARLMPDSPHEKCQRHRPKVSRAGQRQYRPEEYRKRNALKRLRRSVAPGWEAA